VERAPRAPDLRAAFFHSERAVASCLRCCGCSCCGCCCGGALVDGPLHRSPRARRPT